ncbi:MAG: dihydrofolate reductase [Kiritimatiellia bacterium]|jgi:dihydrofolate reductase
MPPRIRVYLACSIDGYIAGPDGDLSWLSEPGGPAAGPTQALEFGTFFAQIGAMLMGRQTHDVVANMGEWPYGDTPVLVATHRPIDVAAPSVRAVSGTITELIAEAKIAAGAADVYLDGGNLVRQALDARLVDEIVLTYIPILLAGGISLFDGLTSRTKLEIVSQHRYGHMLQVTMRPRNDGG